MDRVIPLIRETPYEEVTPVDSISLHGWNKICEWRAENKGNLGVKLGAELGFFANSIFSIFETVVRAPACFLICNKFSKNIAAIVNSSNEESSKNYKELVEKCEASFDQCFQAIAQNFISMGTNLVSHEQNMSTARSVRDRLHDVSQTICREVGNFSPLEQNHNRISTSPISMMLWSGLGLIDTVVSLIAHAKTEPEKRGAERD